MFNETPAEAREILCKALESGDYRQAPNLLEKLDDAGAVVGNCCLGVACREFMKLYPDKLFAVRIGDESRTAFKTSATAFNGNTGILPDVVMGWLGFMMMTGEVETSDSELWNGIEEQIGYKHNELTALNDRGVDFKTIAKVIRESYANS